MLGHVTVGDRGREGGREAPPKTCGVLDDAGLHVRVVVVAQLDDGVDEEARPLLGIEGPSPAEEVVAQRDYALAVQRASREAFASVDFTALGQRAAGSANTWVTVNFGLDRMAGMCEDQVLDEWGDKLAGADVFTHSHCKRMVFHAMTE